MNPKIMDKAIKLAKDLHTGEQNFCAIIVDKRDRILSFGFNSYIKSSPLMKYYATRVGEINKIFNHGEIDAIKHLPYNSKPFAIYVARINFNGKQLLGKPCRICQLALRELGIKEDNIYYT